MKSWIPTKKHVITVSLVALGVLGAYVCSVVLTNGMLNKVSESYRTSGSALASDQQVLFISSVAKNYKEPIEKLRGFFIKKDNDVAFIKQLEEVASTTGVAFEINLIDTKSKKTEGSVQQLIIKLTAEGSWQNVLTFIHSLERMPYGVSIEGVSLQSEETGVWSSSVEFIAYKEN